MFLCRKCSAEVILRENTRRLIDIYGRWVCDKDIHYGEGDCEICFTRTDVAFNPDANI